VTAKLSKIYGKDIDDTIEQDQALQQLRERQMKITHLRSSAHSGKTNDICLRSSAHSGKTNDI